MFKFNCPDLQSAFNDTKASIESSADYMNDISGDISQLEKYIATFNIPNSYSIAIEEQKFLYNEAREFEWFERFEKEGGDVFLLLKKLIWDKDKRRLCYGEFISKTYYSYPDHEQIIPYAEISNKILMETKFVIKKMAHKHLPSMLKAIAKDYGYQEKAINKGYRQIIRVIDDEIPF